MDAPIENRFLYFNQDQSVIEFAYLVHSINTGVNRYIIQVKNGLVFCWVTLILSWQDREEPRRIVRNASDRIQ